MKKYIFILIIIVLISSFFINNVFASIISLDSYSESNYDSNTSMYSTDFNEVGQTFTPNVTATLDSVSFYIKKNGTPVQNMYAKIYAISGTYGTNSRPVLPLLTTSTAIDPATLSTSMSVVTFIFTGSNRITLQAGTHYAVSLSWSGGLGFLVNYILAGYDASSPTHSGNFYSSTSENSWNPSSAADLIFNVNGDVNISNISYSDVIFFE